MLRAILLVLVVVLVLDLLWAAFYQTFVNFAPFLLVSLAIPVERYVGV